MRAGLIAAVLSGLPSTAHALVFSKRPLEATAAAGSLLLPHEEREHVLVATAVPVHLTLSVGWALTLALLLPRRRTTLWGALAGLAIAAFDLGVVSRYSERITRLPLAPQVADHLAYGAIVGYVLNKRRSP